MSASHSWLIPPRLVKVLAVVAGLLGLAIPVVAVRWATLNSPRVDGPDDGPLRPEMVVVPEGSYSVGAEDGDPFLWQRHAVELSRFAISTTEVTQEQYKRVMGENPSEDKACGKTCPVTDVTWLDAVRYMIALSDRDPKVEPCYEINGDEVEWSIEEACTGYRLPTEAEWEAAARATTTARYSGTNDSKKVCDFANVGDASYKAQEKPDYETFDCNDEVAGLAPVGKFLPNGFGLYDMTGNVWEWVWDWHTFDPPVHTSDPRGPKVGQSRVFRGGSFSDAPQFTRVAFRGNVVPSYRYRSVGFRVARSLP